MTFSGSLVRFSQNERRPGRNPKDRSSEVRGTTAPAPIPVSFASTGQSGCLSSTEAILHSFISRGSNILLPSYHHAQTIPDITDPPSSSTYILAFGIHQWPLTLIAGVSFEDQSTINCLERSG